MGEVSWRAGCTPAPGCFWGRKVTVRGTWRGLRGAALLVPSCATIPRDGGGRVKGSPGWVVHGGGCMPGVGRPQAAHHGDERATARGTAPFSP